MGTSYPGRAVLVSLTVVVCAGCASAPSGRQGTDLTLPSPFYNEARDKQGQALKKAVSEVNLVAAVDELETRYAALTELEISTQTTRLATSRDFEIAQVAMSSKGTAKTGSLQDLYVGPLIEARFTSLMGKVPTLEQMSSLTEATAEAEGREKLVAARLREFNAVSGQKLQDCAAAARIATDANPGTAEISADVLADIPPKKKKASALMLRALLAECQKKPPGSIETLGPEKEIKELGIRLASDKRLVSKYREQLLAHTAALKAEQSRYDAEVAATLPNETGYLEKLADIATRLKEGIGKIRDNVGDGSLVMAHAEALEKLEALETLLGALASGEPDASKLSSEERQAVMIVRLIPAVADEADKLFKQAQRPRLAPFLLAKEHQRLAVEGFQRHVALLDRRVLAREQQLAAAHAEVRALSKARLALANKSVKVDLNRTLPEVVDAGPPQSRYGLYRSLGHYFDDAHRHRVDQEVLQLNIDSMAYDIEIQKSRTAALMWENLMSNMASVMADFHAAGVKPAELAEFFKGFGLLYIGGRAGK